VIAVRYVSDRCPLDIYNFLHLGLKKSLDNGLEVVFLAQTS
jgi:hypothetical protein